MKLGNPQRTNKTKKRLTSQSPPKKQRSAERQGGEHTREERFYKKSLQEIIRSAYEKSPHIQRPALHGAKNSSRLCRFFDSLVSESSECKSSQQVQKFKTKDHSKTEENYFTQRSHNIFQQLAVRKWGFLREGRFQRVTQIRAERCDSKYSDTSKLQQSPSAENDHSQQEITQPVMMWLVLSSQRRG